MRSTRPAMILSGVLWISFAFAADVAGPQNPEWTEPFPPFRIAESLYYVGSKGLASYLITTPEGHILINSDLEASVPLLRASVESLGFRFDDIEILLISHAHFDHAAGSAMIQRATGARYMVMDGDADVVESGGKTDFRYGSSPETFYPPAKVDRVLPCDYFLGSHGSYFDLERKYARLKEGARMPFVDPEGYKSFVAEREQTFRAELTKQRSASKTP